MPEKRRHESLLKKWISRKLLLFFQHIKFAFCCLMKYLERFQDSEILLM